MKFRSKNPQYEYLRKKWVAKNKQVTEGLFEKHFRKAALGSLGGMMILTTPGMQIQSDHLLPPPAEHSQLTANLDKNAVFATKLQENLPQEVRNLTSEEEARVASLLSQSLGLDIKAEIDNKRLNKTYSLIGAEQHLYRYSGDTLQSHARDAQDWAMYGKSGIAPGLGAWGYFASSKQAFSQKEEERERWYVVAQTFLSPGFSERVREYRDFYRFRKMIVVNPKTGQAVVGDMGDVGPAEYTGKSFGGSPEVMYELGLGGGPRKGAVLFFFVDDPEDKIPLGPIKPVDLENTIAQDDVKVIKI